MPQLLDTIRPRPTPEGCELDLQIAGPMSRAMAWGIDAGLRLMLWTSIAQTLIVFGRAGIGLIFLSGFLIEWLMPVLFEVLWRGQTPGKRLLDLAVVHDDGTPVGWAASLARNTVRVVDFLPVAYATGYVSMLVSADAKRLGDLLAGTVVVQVGRGAKAAAWTEDGRAEPPAFPLTPEEQRAVIEFGRRSPSLTDERARELALVAKPLVGGLRSGDAVARLQCIARFLLGAR
jgi:uncharacterized RDD family membrane protein YckC